MVGLRSARTTARVVVRLCVVYIAVVAQAASFPAAWQWPTEGPIADSDSALASPLRLEFAAQESQLIRLEAPEEGEVVYADDASALSSYSSAVPRTHGLILMRHPNELWSMFSVPKGLLPSVQESLGSGTEAAVDRFAYSVLDRLSQRTVHPAELLPIDRPLAPFDIDAVRLEDGGSAGQIVVIPADALRPERLPRRLLLSDAGRIVRDIQFATDGYEEQLVHEDGRVVLYRVPRSTFARTIIVEAELFDRGVVTTALTVPARQ